MRPTFIFQRELHHISNITETSESVLNYQRAFWHETALPGITTDIDILGGGLLAAKMTSWSRPASESLHLMSMRHWPQIFTTKWFTVLSLEKACKKYGNHYRNSSIFIKSYTVAEDAKWPHLSFEDCSLYLISSCQFIYNRILFTEYIFHTLKKKWIENLSVVTFAYAKCTFQSLG